MFRVQDQKCGGVTIETDCDVETVIQRNEMVHFLYLTEKDFQELFDALITRGARRLAHD